MEEEVKGREGKGGEGGERKIRMADDGATAEGSLGRLWPEDSFSRDQVWTDDRDEDTVPLLEEETGQLLNLDFTLDWSGSWNSQGCNPFKVEEWKSPSNRLLEGRKWLKYLF